MDRHLALGAVVVATGNRLDTEDLVLALKCENNNIVGTGRAPDIEAELKNRLLQWHEHTPWLDDPDCGPDRRHLFDKNGMPLTGQGGLG